MHPLVLAVALAAQYPSPQQPQYVPSQLVYSVPAPTYAAPSVVTLGAGQVVQAGPIGQMLGHVGAKLQKHSWPRVQPIAATPAPGVVYVQVQQPQAVQASYVVAQPQQQYAPPPVGIPTPPAKIPPPVPYGSPQQQPAGYGAQAPRPSESVTTPTPTPGAPRPSESVPPVPNR